MRKLVVLLLVLCFASLALAQQPSAPPSITFTWTPSTTPGALTSILCRPDPSNGVYLPITTAPVSGSSFTYTGTAWSTNYTCVATATANNVTSAYSNQVSVKTPDPTAAPTGLTVKLVAVP